ncbi:BTB/POZ domain-containing protein 1/2 [Mytilus galloprovincialis]|uniref:BTB/POZ domain-containing protein 1/2 n=1 Tax=Mytilus galloprovincialis TaxID=29158 RepID=A0A8B6G302_MYTGA|nr:BTB/POZ domain-containing protein 1/2 [Mytilus galloprovincialis]
MTITKRLQEAYRAGRFCNVQLVCEDDKVINCHSVILQTSSSFFEEKLSDKWSDADNQSTVNCNNFHIDTMQMVIDFIYDFHIDITYTNVADLLHACTYFLIDDLLAACQLFLEKAVCDGNVFNILTISDQFHLNSVKEKCFHYIDSKFVYLGANFVEDFYALPLELMVQIVSRDSLVVSEEFLFDIISVFCSNNEVPDIWDSFTPHIRFGFMSISFFASRCVFDHILPTLLCNKIFQYISSTEDISFTEDNRYKKICVPRLFKTNNDIVVNRFMVSNNNSLLLCNNIDGERLSFTIDNTCNLRSVGVYGKANMSFLARLKVYKTTSNEIIGKIDRRIVCQSNVVFLMFKAPLLLLAGTCYTLQLFMEGKECVQGSVGAAIRQCSNVDGDQNIITFKEPVSGNTTVNGGQFPILVFSKN